MIYRVFKREAVYAICLGFFIGAGILLFIFFSLLIFFSFSLLLA